MKHVLALVALGVVTLAAAGCGSASKLVLAPRPVRVVKTISLRPGDVRQFSRSMHVTGYDVQCTHGLASGGIVIQRDLWGRGGRTTVQQGSQAISLTATPKADSQLTFSCTNISS